MYGMAAHLIICSLCMWRFRRSAVGRTACVRPVDRVPPMALQPLLQPEQSSSRKAFVLIVDSMSHQQATWFDA